MYEKVLEMSFYSMCFTTAFLYELKNHTPYVTMVRPSPLQNFFLQRSLN